MFRLIELKISISNENRKKLVILLFIFPWLIFTGRHRTALLLKETSYPDTIVKNDMFNVSAGKKKDILRKET